MVPGVQMVLEWCDGVGESHVVTIPTFVVLEWCDGVGESHVVAIPTFVNHTAQDESHGVRGLLGVSRRH